MNPTNFVAASRILNLAKGMVGDDGAGRNFRDLAVGLARARSLDEMGLLSSHPDPVLQGFQRKAALLGDAVWHDHDVAQLVQTFIASIAPVNLLDQLARWGTVVPSLATTALVASGFSTDVVAQGAPKAVYGVDLSRLPTEPQKAAGIVVLSQELFNTPSGDAVFLRELEKATLRAQNGALLDIALTNSPSTNVGGGATLTGLRNALAVSEPSAGYVAVASSASLAVLETYLEARELERIAFVPFDDLPGGVKMVVIAASRVALADHGMTFKPSRHASIQMSATPASPVIDTTVMVSLFQHGLVALLVERAFRCAIEDAAVVTVGA